MSKSMPIALALTLTIASVPAARAQEAPDLSDPEIAHVAVTANAIDIEMGELAVERATDDGVRAFARSMIDAHTGVNARAAALAERLGVVPADNAVSRSLRDDADGAKASLRTLRGERFDRAYMEREVAYHQAVLDALEGVLIPGADNAELEALLVEVRPVIAAHLEHARGLLADLQPAG